MLYVKSYVKISNDVSYLSLNQEDIEWLLRFGSEKEILKRRYYLASIVSAYQALINQTQPRRNHICKVLKDAEKMLS